MVSYRFCYFLHYVLSLEFETSHSAHAGQTRKRPYDATGDEIHTPEKQHKLMEEEDSLSHERCSMRKSSSPSMQAPALPESRRRPLRTSNQGSGGICGDSRDLYRSGKGWSSIGEFDENSGDLLVDPESELFTLDREAVEAHANSKTI